MDGRVEQWVDGWVGVESGGVEGWMRVYVHAIT